MWGAASSEKAWHRFVTQDLDKRLYEAISRYEQDYACLRADDLAEACNRFFRWALPRPEGGDPDYNLHATPVIYALEDGPQQVACVLRALSRLFVADRAPPIQRRVLDIGSGLDAVSIALEAAGLLASDAEVVCVEPSKPMSELARRIELKTARRTWVEARIEDLIRGSNGGASVEGPFDSIFFSYAFQYRHESVLTPNHYQKLAQRCSEWLTANGLLLVLGPSAKRKPMEQFKDAFLQSGQFKLIDHSNRGALGDYQYLAALPGPQPPILCKLRQKYYQYAACATMPSLKPYARDMMSKPLKTGCFDKQISFALRRRWPEGVTVTGNAKFIEQNADLLLSCMEHGRVDGDACASLEELAPRIGCDGRALAIHTGPGLSVEVCHLHCGAIRASLRRSSSAAGLTSTWRAGGSNCGVLVPPPEVARYFVRQANGRWMEFHPSAGARSSAG